MKHAVMITAHRSPELLVELIDAMATPRAHVFVHVDLDATYTPQDLSSRLAAPERVTMLEPRSVVNWRGYSYLTVILRLLRLAHDSGPFGFYHLLTGQCFPTKRPDEIYDTFEAHPDSDQIEYFRLTTDRWAGGGLNRMQFYHPYDKLDARKRVLGAPVNRRLIFGLVRAQQMLGLRRDLPSDFASFYGGSVFWSLTGSSVDHVLTYLDEHPDFEPHFRNTDCPEEIMFQTLLANSDRADRMTGTSLRYIDWTYRNGSIPANLDESDFERIVDSGALFARKVDFEYGGILLERLRRRAGIGKSSGPT